MLSKQLRLFSLSLLISCMIFVRPVCAVPTTSFSQYTALTVAGVGVLGAIIASAFSSKQDNKSVDDGSKITTNDIYFDAPAISKDLVLTNPTALSVTVGSITFDDSVHGITIAENNCQVVAANSSCTAKLIASANAYGEGKVNIAYGNGHQATGNIKVAGVSLQLCELKNNVCEIIAESNDLTIKKDSNVRTGTFHYKNIGNFAWQNPSISWKVDFDNNIGGAVVLLTTTDPDQIPIPAQGFFKFTLTANKDEPGNWGVLEAAGTNLNTIYLKNILSAGGIEVINNLDPADQHLGYHSVKLVSTVASGTVTINTFDPPTITNDKIKYCAPGDADCYYQTDSNCVKDGVLDKNSSCKVWFKSINNGVTDLYETAEGTIKISLEANWSDKTQSFPETEVFSVVADQALYIGGWFTNIANHLAKWNGTKWGVLASGFDDVYAFAVMNGDLYVGGIASSLNNVAKWNGANLLSLGSGVNNTVYAFAADDGSNALYVGGSFTATGNGVLVNHVAKWDAVNSAWSSLGGGTGGSRVNALAFAKNANSLYVGGSFNAVGLEESSVSANNIAKWNTANSGWSTLGSGVDKEVSALALAEKYNSLYVGGVFKTAGGNTANCIAKWDTSASLWSAMGNISGTSDPIVSALTIVDNSLYVGGDFSSVGSGWVVNALCIARWDLLTLTWSALVGSTLSMVKALAGIGSSLYVGGWYNGNDAIAKWDTLNSSWSSFGGVVLDDQVNAATIATSIVSFVWKETLLSATK